MARKSKITLGQLILDKYGSYAAFSRVVNRDNPASAYKNIQNWTADPNSIKLGTAKRLSKLLGVDICEVANVKGIGDE